MQLSAQRSVLVAKRNFISVSRLLRFVEFDLLRKLFSYLPRTKETQSVGEHMRREAAKEIRVFLWIFNQDKFTCIYSRAVKAGFYQLNYNMAAC